MRIFQEKPKANQPARGVGRPTRSCQDIYEMEADRVAGEVTAPTRGETAHSSLSFSRFSGEQQPVPASVRQTIAEPGKPLETEVRNDMERRFQYDFSRVRVHADTAAEVSARAMGADAFTAGNHVVFAADRFAPKTHPGKRLLAHELTHVVQQSGNSFRASSPILALQRQPASPTATDAETKKPKTNQITISVPPALLQQFQLTPPSWLAPPKHPSIFSPGQYSLGDSGRAGAAPSPSGQVPALGHPGASLFQPPSQYTPSQYTPSPLAPTSPAGPSLFPPGPGSGSAAPATAPKAPDRLSFHDFGPLSVGVRIGFPDLSKDAKPGDPPSALQESLKKGEILNFIYTSQPPSEYSLDPGKLVGAIWGIFSTKIDPGMAQKIAAGMASKPTGTGLSYQLDATLLLNLGGPKSGGGGGATLTVIFP